RTYVLIADRDGLATRDYVRARPRRFRRSLRPTQRVEMRDGLRCLSLVLAAGTIGQAPSTRSLFPRRRKYCWSEVACSAAHAICWRYRTRRSTFCSPGSVAPILYASRAAASASALALCACSGLTPYCLQ